MRLTSRSVALRQRPELNGSVTSTIAHWAIKILELNYYPVLRQVVVAICIGSNFSSSEESDMIESILEWLDNSMNLSAANSPLSSPNGQRQTEPAAQKSQSPQRRNSSQPADAGQAQQ